MARVEPGVPASVDARLLLDAVLNRIDVAVCLYDPQDRVVLWNEAYLRFFPEEAGILRHGLPYAETLRRYFEENLTAAEAETFPLHLAAGLERHRRLDGPYIYQRRDGRWYEVQPHRLPDGHLLKIWTDVTANQAEQAARDGITEVVAGTIGFARYDQQGRFVLANKAMATMFPRLIDLFRPGATYADHLLRIAGTSLHEAERPRIEGLAARPDPVAALEREPLIFQGREGGWLQLEEQRLRGSGFTSLWTDVTRRMNAEAQVDRLQERLADAIEALADGFALYDADDRLVVCNRQYRDLNAATADLLVPGVSWYDVLRAGTYRGQFADAIGREEEWLEERRRQRARPGELFEVKLSDGRWMRVVDWKTSDGGIVGIRRDITAAKQREAELHRRTAMLDAIGYAAGIIVGHAGWQEGVRQLISRLGEAAEVSRVSVFQIHEHPTLGQVQSCRFDWAEPGLETLSDNPLNWNQSLTEGDSLFLEWTARRRAGQPIQVMTRDLSGDLRREFEYQGTLSFVSVPIFVNGEWWGHIGFDDCRTERVWTPIEIDVLHTAGNLIAGAVERAQVEERLRQSEDRYRKLVNLLPDGVMLHDREGIVFLNPAGCAILGLDSPEEARGRPYTDFLAEPLSNAEGDAIRMLETGGEIPFSRRQVRTRDGRRIFVEATAVPFPYDGTPAALLLFRDITGRIETECELARYRGQLEDLVAQRTEALKAAEERLVAAINTFKDGFVLYGGDERLIVANRAIIDFTPELAGILKPGASMTEVTQAIAAARGLDDTWVEAELARLRRPDEFNEERTLADGRCIVVSVRHPPDGSTLIVGTDVTPYRNATEALRQALHKEKQLSQLQREFISMTSHEFRTPLAIIDAATQRLMRRGRQLVQAEFEQLGNEIRGAVARMVGHIDAILSTAHLDLGQIRFRPQPCDLGGILAEVCRRQQAIAPQHRFVVELDRLPERVVVDPGLMDQIATNILTNAVKYSPDGGDIVVRGWQEEGAVVWSVTDHGIGIPAEDLPYILQRFYRARTSVGIAGTGLGLSLVDKLVAMHDGSMDIASVVGKGTTVTVRLPLGDPAERGKEAIRGNDLVH